MAAPTNEACTETKIILTGLRQELKQWETSFAAAHEGRKAGREDIKQHPEIAEKYKRYTKLRQPPQQHPPIQAGTPAKKRHQPSTSDAPVSPNPPNKRPRSTHFIRDSGLETYVPPAATYLSPTAHRISIGPTPQKDGQILGLFDRLLTGSKSKTPSQRKYRLLLGSDMQATPSKRPATQDGGAEPAVTGMIDQVSPLGLSKGSKTNALLTPSATRISKSDTSSLQNSVSNIRFVETPAFLRRDSQRAFTGKESEGVEDEVSWSPVVVRKLPMPAGKGLSTLVKGLRDMEDEKLDEDLEMLREIENVFAPSSKATLPKELDNDNQRPDMPLGPDGNIESSDSETEKEGNGRDGKPLRVWKKKGQKRTTRRVLMKPNVTKWKPEPAWKSEVESGEDGGEAVVQETQALRTGARDKPEQYEDELGTVDEMKGLDRGKERAKKVRKKISATAHANFRALKIKNKSFKGRAGGRFGRRR